MEIFNAHWPYTTVNVVNGYTYTQPSTGRWKVVNKTTVEGDFKKSNPYHVLVEDRYPLVGTHTWYYIDKGQGYANISTGLLNGEPTYASDAAGPAVHHYNEVNQKCMSKLYDDVRGNGMLSVDLIEGKKTARMLLDGLKLHKVIAEFLNEFAFGAKGRVRRIRKVRGKRTIVTDERLSTGQSRLDYLSSKWLEFRYGWSPTVASIYDAFDRLGKDVNYGHQHFHARAGKRIEEEMIYNGFETKTTVSYRHQIGITLNLDPSLQRYDWTSLNPVVVGWELLTLSFVVDWFVKIGQCLTLWENYWLFNNKFVSGYSTTSELRTSSTIYRLSIKHAPVPNPVLPSTSGRFSEERLDYAGWSRRIETRRTVMLQLPTPGVPVVRMNLNASKFMDLATLTQQLLAKKLR